MSMTGANETNDGIVFASKSASTFNFSCTIAANPFFNVTWIREGQWLADIMMSDNSDQPTIKRNDSIDGQYEYTYLLKPHERYSYEATVKGRFLDMSMFAQYKCHVSNEYGSDEKSINIVELKT